MNTPEISLRPAGEKDRQLIRNIFNMYQNELSVYSDDFTHLDENGYFAPDTVNEILPFGNGVFPYIVTSDGKNIGFVMATDRTYAPPGADYCLEEIFLIRPFRGTGAADEAMRCVMKERIGVWSLEVYRENKRALLFWERFLSQNARNVQSVSAPGNMVRFTCEYPGEKPKV